MCFETPAAECFLQRAELVSQADEIGLPAAGRHHRQRPHMFGDDILLPGTEAETGGGIAQGCLGVREAMQTMAVVRPMPVVEEEIMEHSAAEEGTGLHRYPQPARELKAGPRHRHAVVQAGNRPMLAVIPHPPDVGVGQKAAGHTIKDLLLPNCQLHEITSLLPQGYHFAPRIQGEKCKNRGKTALGQIA